MTTTFASAKALYEELEEKRRPFLERARDSVRLTVPALLPPEGHNSANRLPTPYQGIGARGVNNLASKLLLSLLPPNAPFFRLRVSPFKIAELTGLDDVQEEVEESLLSMERAVSAEVETELYRVKTFEALKHLIAAGNALLFLPDDGGMRVFHLDQYVIERDPMGNVLTIVTKESIDRRLLPASVRDRAMPTPEQIGKRFVDLYTVVRREKNGDTFKVMQEAGGATVPSSQGKFREEEMPYIPLRFSHVSNESYGRGHVEEYFGDLKSLEALTQAIVEGSAAAAKTLFLVNPNGTTRARTLATAPNGAIREGNAADVTTLKVDKAADFRVAFTTIEQIRDRLGFAFLLNSSVQRDAERVTAEEVRFMAQELEDTLGGVYSILAQEFQLPLVRRLLAKMTKSGDIPPLPEGLVEPSVVTGIEALGRGHDLTRLAAFFQMAQQTFGPEAVAQWTNVDAGLSRIATAAGVETVGLLKSPEEVAQAQQAAQAQQLIETLGPEGLRQMGAAIQNQQNAGPPAEQ